MKIAELYALPLEEFTKARNALAKTLTGRDKKEIASLVKPSLAMWVVNQLYWQDAPTYNALVDASEKQRDVHRAALNGRKADPSKANDLHRTTLEKAFTKATSIAQKKGVSLTDTVRDAVRRTLAALPTDETPGRLTREPPPVGFSLLTGIKPRPIHADSSKRSEQKKPRADPPRPNAKEQQQRKLEEKRRKDADATARQDEQRARKEQDKRERAIKKAEQALREAERRLAELKG